MLPDDFSWAKVADFESKPTAVYVNDLAVCRLVERLDGSWFVNLDYHLPPPDEAALHPSRNCRSYETGRAGCEEWARRHEVRLRAETAAIALKKWGAIPRASF